MATAKRLYRSNTDKTWLGIFGGIGEYLELDPVLLRVAFLLVTVFTGFFPGLVFYILAAAVIPLKK